MQGHVLTLEELKNKVIPILCSYPVNKAVLFGSYANNEATENSDIDLFIDTDGKLRGLDFIGLLEELVYILGRDIDLLDKTHINPESDFAREIEKKGIILYEKS